MAPAPTRLAGWLGVALLGGWGCSWSEVPRDAIFACDNGACPAGFECRSGYCAAQARSDSGAPAGDACTPATCAQAKASCGPISDGCGKILQCGSCGSPATCGGGPDGGTPNTCGCTPLTATVACQIAGRNCGVITRANGCGALGEFTCGGACPPDAGCLQETGPELCARALHRCGTLGVTDRCGIQRLVDCGGCGDGGACFVEEPNDGGAVSHCGPCVPEDDATLCDRNGANCGALQATDACGQLRTLACGVDCLTEQPDGGSGKEPCGTRLANQCACQPLRAGCLVTAQCCPGSSCGTAGLCCLGLGVACSDDADCCGTASCAARLDGGAACSL